jgi:polyhydroxyalkanoate synthesis regulator phasin
VIDAKSQKQLAEIIDRCSTGKNNNMDELRRDVGGLANILQKVIQSGAVERELSATGK